MDTVLCWFWLILWALQVGSWVSGGGLNWNTFVYYKFNVRTMYVKYVVGGIWREIPTHPHPWSKTLSLACIQKYTYILVYLIYLLNYHIKIKILFWERRKNLHDFRALVSDLVSSLNTHLTHLCILTIKFGHPCMLACMHIRSSLCVLTQVCSLLATSIFLIS